MMPAARDITGQRFGILTAKSRGTQRSRSGKAITNYRCRCDCGEEIVVITSNLTRGNTKSCGCLQRSQTSDRFTTHGMTDSPGYSTWKGIKDRCLNPNTKAYRNYGGRGISVCDRWRNSFADFILDMGAPPTPEHSIDRIDNDGDYQPGNCRWATKLTQGRNRRGLIAVEGASCLKAAAEAAGVKYGTVHSRIHRDGWTVDQALETPPVVGQKTTNGTWPKSQSPLRSRGFAKTRQS